MENQEKDYLFPYESYFNTAYDTWLGKFIGGTLGAPFEGFKRFLEVDVCDLLPLKIVENDDTDLQILWLHALQEHGIDLTSEHMIKEWREHVKAPWSEYGVAVANWERGILPPESGRRDNWFFGNGMGCPIRSEIWGMICPGIPKLAAKYAKQDAELDHFGESVFAEVFLATLESTVFVEKDLQKLISIGLNHIPTDCLLANLVESVIAWSKVHDWKTVRSLILRDFGHPDFTNSPQNMGFTILALIAGEGDFMKTMNIAIGCAYDSDCTAASAGAILNAINGSKQLPESISGAITDTYKISDWMLGFPSSGSIVALTHATCDIGIEIVKRERLHDRTNLKIIDTKGRIRPEPIQVELQEVEAINPVDKPFPEWIVLGPYFRDWTEISPQHEKFPDHALPDLPSVKYMAQMHSGFDQNYIDPSTISKVGLNGEVQNNPMVFSVRSEDSRLLLKGIPDAGGPCSYYAYSEFHSPVAVENWLLAGSSGPIEIWLNGKHIVKSDSYQQLNPCSFDEEVFVQSGTNRLVLKLEKTSQEVEVFIQFKKHEQKHWHQCFINTSICWQALEM